VIDVDAQAWHPVISPSECRISISA
jgi:hypothetical protein